MLERHRNDSREIQSIENYERKQHGGAKMNSSKIHHMFDMEVPTNVMIAEVINEGYTPNEALDILQIEAEKYKNLIRQLRKGVESEIRNIHHR